MTIKKLSLKFFGLIKEATIIPGSVNIITGSNNDVSIPTGNSVGKSTLQNAITFLIWGEVPGINLNDLISFGCVYTQVEGEIDNLKIIRRVPNSLKIYEDGIELDFNTASIGQNYLNKRYGTMEQFKKYRCMDISKGLDLLSYCSDTRSVITLRKELMSFIDDMFSTMRKGLLDKKLDRETYSIDKRLYKYSLSQKRLQILDDGLQTLVNNANEAKQDTTNQNETVNQIKIEIQSITNIVDNLYKQIEKDKLSISQNAEIITDYHRKIEELKEQPLQTVPEIINYDDLLKQVNEEINQKEKELVIIETDIENKTPIINILNKTCTELTIQKLQEEKSISQLRKEIENIKNLTEGKCDKCGNPITEDNKDKFIGEKEIITLEKEVIITQIITNLNEYKKKIIKLNEELEQKLSIKNNLKSLITDKRSELCAINNKKVIQTQELNEITNQQTKKESEIQKYEELISTYIKQNEDYSFQLVDNNVDLVKQISRLEELKLKSVAETDALKYTNTIVETIEIKQKRTESYLLKLREAFKFSEYKYTGKDILLYTESIKVLDSFASFYVQDWLSQLSIIMNNLLTPMNLTIDFVDSKEFIKIKDNGKELKYSQLSSGQKSYIGCVFKISILLQQGQTDGILLFDEGLNNLHKVNFMKLVETLKGLNFQSWIIYQNVEEIKDVKIFNLIRKNGITEVR